MLAWDQRMIEAKIFSWIVNMGDKELPPISLCSHIYQQ
jgi:hypothetical protein